MWKIFKKFSWLYKFGIPILLGFILLSRIMEDSVFMMMYRDVLWELVIISFLFREFFESFRRHKCMWQVASICGVLTYSISNIVYYTNEKNEAILDYQYIGVGIWCFVVLIYLIKDNYGARKFKYNRN